MSYRELHNVGKIPVFQNKMFGNREESLACPLGDLLLAQDMETGLVSNVLYDASLVRYDDRYQNEQGCSDRFRRHLDKVAGIVEKYARESEILEIGCGKGSFVEYLRNRGLSVIGLDPAYEGDRPYVLKTAFTSGENLGVSGDCIVLRHVLEHIPRPVTFLREILRANRRSALVYIEVPDFEWIIRNRAWFDVFYEHVNYFRRSDLLGMFDRVCESGTLFGGQYLYIVAELDTLRSPTHCEPVDFPEDFYGGLQETIDYGLRGKTLAIWGAAAKGMMLAFYLRRAGVEVECAIDINPAKQGKYLAGSGLLALPPARALSLLKDGDIVFVMNSNYLDEIKEMSHNRFNYVPVDGYEL